MGEESAEKPAAGDKETGQGPLRACLTSIRRVPLMGNYGSLGCRGGNILYLGRVRAKTLHV